MIVKQVSFDIEVNDSNIDLEKIISDMLERRGYNVLGSNQEDLSDYYDYKDHNKEEIEQ
jgi:hypothetical protein